MADPKHLEILGRGAHEWNSWRGENPNLLPDLDDALLNGAFLSAHHLKRVSLRRAKLQGAMLYEVDLGEANLEDADLSAAQLSGARLFKTRFVNARLEGAFMTCASAYGADFTGANLRDAQMGAVLLTRASLSKASLVNADLQFARLVETDLSGSDLAGCQVYGASVWDVVLTGATQTDLVITPSKEPTITVDNLEVAQLIYLLTNNEAIRRLIDSITSKVVLILGRFTPERKAILDWIRQQLRQAGYSPVLFDFERPSSRTFTETVSTLAHLARFVIADITDPKSIPQELQSIVPSLTSVPVAILLAESEIAYGMFGDFLRYPWVLSPFRYANLEMLQATFAEKVIAVAEAKARGLTRT